MRASVDSPGGAGSSLRGSPPPGASRLHSLYGAIGGLAAVLAVALIGRGFPGAHEWGLLPRFAIYLAAALSIFGAAIFSIAWTGGLLAGEQVPRWLPVPLALAVLAGALALYFALEGRQDQDIAQTVRAGAEGARNQIAVRMEARFQSLARRARDWEISGAPTQAAWEASAASYVHDLPDVQALEWIDASRSVRWVFPRAEASGPDGLPLDARSRAALEEAAKEDQPVVSGITSLPGGGLGFVIYAPIVINGQSDGFLGTVFKAETCLQRYLPTAVADGEAIAVSESGMLFYKRDADAPPMREDWIVQEKVKLRGATWVLRTWPTPALAARLDSPLPAVVLCAGALGALLLGSVSYYAQRSARQAKEAARANAALQAALDTVKTLEGLLPICCYCKRVRDDTGYWSQIDSYLRKHTNASLSHGYCPECAVKFYEECGIEVPDKVKAELDAHNFE